MPAKPAAPAAGAGAAPSGPRVIASRDLLGGDRIVVIRHGTEDYRLQITSSGKLILTK